MTDEISFFWDDILTGDAREGPHASVIIAMIWNLLLQSDDTVQGVIRTDHLDFASQLVVTNPAGNNIRMADGAALVKGRLYTNDANEDETIITPSVATRVDRLILRVIFAEQTVRKAIVTGSPGAGTPTLQQDDDIWEIPLALISITTGGVITVTDDRTFAVTPLSSGVAQSFVVIDEFTSTGVETEAEFSSIPQTNKDLLILGMCRHIDNTGVSGETEWAELGVQFNDDASGSYSNTTDFNRVSTAGAQTVDGDIGVNLTYGNGYFIATNDAAANHFSPVLIEIADYADVDFNKTFRITSSVHGGAAGRPSAIHSTGLVWKKVSSISKIKLFNPGAPGVAWTTGTKFMLIGIN